MNVSDQGLVALMQHEGIVPGPYFDSVGVLTYGIGHTVAAGAPDPRDLPLGMPPDLDVALRDVMAVFRRDVVKYAAEVNAAVKVPLAQHEFDALVSFHYNTGAIRKATLTAVLNEGQSRINVAALFGNWLKPASIKSRRYAERDLFLHGHYPKGNINVWQVNAKRAVIWKAARSLSPDEALALLKGDMEPRRELQGLLGVVQDNIWGPKSQAALDAFKEKAKRVDLLQKEIDHE